MFTTKLKLGAVALVASCTIAVPGVLAWQDAAGSGRRPTRRPCGEPSEVVGRPEGRRRDPEVGRRRRPAPAAAGSHWSSSPTGAARSSTCSDPGGRPPRPRRYYLWSRRLLEAQTAAATSRDERTAALKAYVDRMGS